MRAGRLASLAPTRWGTDCSDLALPAPPSRVANGARCHPGMPDAGSIVPDGSGLRRPRMLGALARVPRGETGVLLHHSASRLRPLVPATRRCGHGLTPTTAPASVPSRAPRRSAAPRRRGGGGGHPRGGPEPRCGLGRGGSHQRRRLPRGSARDSACRGAVRPPARAVARRAPRDRPRGRCRPARGGRSVRHRDLRRDGGGPRGGDREPPAGLRGDPAQLRRTGGAGGGRGHPGRGGHRARPRRAHPGALRARHMPPLGRARRRRLPGPAGLPRRVRTGQAGG